MGARHGREVHPGARVHRGAHQYDPVSGSHTGDVDARLAALDSEGVTKELAFPNSILALFGWPDREVRELCFRIYNEHIAEVQERSDNRIYGVGLINWWDPKGPAGPSAS